MANGKEIILSFQPTEKKRASEAIYDQIRELIIRGELKPGDRLPSERNMMEQLQRSRPTIREALRMLEREGFIHTVAGSNGAVVQKLSSHQVEQSITALLYTNTITLRQLYEVRRIVETGTAAWAAERCTPEDLEYIGALLDEMDSCLDDNERFVSLDPRFHGAIARASQNRAAYIIVRVLRQSVKNELDTATQKRSPSGALEMNRKIAYMHRCIYNAIAAHDPQAARQAMELHMQAFMNDLSRESRENNGEEAPAL